MRWRRLDWPSYCSSRMEHVLQRNAPVITRADALLARRFVITTPIDIDQQMAQELRSSKSRDRIFY